MVFENFITTELSLKVNGKTVYMLTLIQPIFGFVLKMSFAISSAASLQVLFRLYFFMEVNNMNPDQTAPLRAV